MTVTAPPEITADNVATLFPDVDTSLARDILQTRSEQKEPRSSRSARHTTRTSWDLVEDNTSVLRRGHGCSTSRSLLRLGATPSFGWVIYSMAPVLTNDIDGTL